MKFKLILAMIALSFSVFSTNVLAQSLWGKLKNRVQDEVENVVTGKVARKAGEKAGEATDAVLDPKAAQEQDEQQSQEPSESQGSDEVAGVLPSNNPLSGFGGLGGMMNALKQEVAINDQYRFDLSVVASQSYKGDTSIMKQGFSESAFMIDSDADNQIVMDLENQAIIMIDNKARTKTAMSTQFIKQMAKMGGQAKPRGQTEPIDIGSISNTGKSKKLLGFTVQKWVFDNGKEKGEVWITDEIDFDFISFSKKLMTTFGNEQHQVMFDFSSLQGDYPRGLALESKTTIGGRQESHYLVKEISQDPNVMDLGSYGSKPLVEGF